VATVGTLRIFISSTSEDLREFRQAAKDAVLKMGWYPEMMENFGAGALPTVEFCRSKVTSCDLVLLIAAFRRGWVPPPENGGNGVDSMTAIELAAARANNIPALAFLAEDTWPGNLYEKTDEGRQWVEQFRTHLNVPAVFFEHERAAGLPAFRAKIEVELAKELTRRQAELAAASPASVPQPIDDYPRAFQALLDGGSVLFFGSGVYGKGPLSSTALAHALREGDAPAEPSLATAAEYCERFRGDRQHFLKRLHDVIVEQAKVCVAPDVYEVARRAVKRGLANAEARRRPVLVVSTCWDSLLEDRLAALDPVVVAHVVRSEGGEHDGKIVLLKAGTEPTICAADQVDLRGERCIVYKPMGSPILNELASNEIDIDTVVATEADHLLFLARLQNQATQIPTAFSRLLQKQTLLVVGYPLDPWQQRLVAQVIHSVARRSSDSAVLSVRRPQGPLEEFAWRQLHASLVRMEVDDFAQRVLGDWPSEPAAAAVAEP
jgi:hypothetical protein